MTALVWRGKCLRMRREKGPFRALRARRRRNRPLAVPLRRPWTNTG